MNEELKPVRCGCGGEAKVQGLNGGERWFVFCRNCRTDSDIYETEAEAITAWNRAMGAERKIAYDPKTKIYYPEGYVPEKLGSKNHE